MRAQVEQQHNALLDACERFREDMGEVADNVSLAAALETLWAERVQGAAASGAVLGNFCSSTCAPVKSGMTLSPQWPVRQWPCSHAKAVTGSQGRQKL